MTAKLEQDKYDSMFKFHIQLRLDVILELNNSQYRIQFIITNPIHLNAYWFLLHSHFRIRYTASSELC